MLLVTHDFKKIILTTIISFLIFSSLSIAKQHHIISDYHQTFIAGYNQNDELRIAIRMYYAENTQYYLAVDPQNFTTETISVADFRIKKITNTNKNYAPMQTLQETPYIKAVTRHTSPPYLLENGGAQRAETNVAGYFLTVDLCPSSKPFEKKIIY